MMTVNNNDANNRNSEVRWEALSQSLNIETCEEQHTDRLHPI